METLTCGHVAHAGPRRLCRHLIDAVETDDGIDYVRLLTGHALDADLCCASCDTARQEGATVELRQVCEGCVAQFDDGDVGFQTGWRGEPGIAERPEPVDTALTVTPLGLDGVLDIAAMPAGGWLVLTDSAELVLVGAGAGTRRRVAASTVPDEPDHEPWAGQALRRRLHVSGDGRFAAVVHDHGRRGQVIDLAGGDVTLTLHGGDYRPETVPFSLAFAAPRGRTVVVHRTAWNRLDVSDPATGESLTGREPLDERLLDYFHGALHASPSGRWLADDGWVWAPAGIPTVWGLDRWLDNPWESEDGPTRRRLCQRDYLWTTPMCWIGDDLLAVSGIGTDDVAMLPGVRIFDAGSGEELHTFAGPRGHLFAAGRRLYSAAPAGLEIWDPFTGHRTGRVPGFVPTHHHRAAGELVEIRDGALVRWLLRPPGNHPRNPGR